MSSTTRRGFITGCSTAVAAYAGTHFNTLAFGAPIADNEDILISVFLRGGIDGLNVVRFLLSYAAFPRSVQGCFDELRSVLVSLPNVQPILAALDSAEGILSDVDPGARDSEGLDRSMDRVQIAIGEVADLIHRTYAGSVL